MVYPNITEALNDAMVIWMKQVGKEVRGQSLVLGYYIRFLLNDGRSSVNGEHVGDSVGSVIGRQKPEKTTPDVNSCLHNGEKGVSERAQAE